MKRRGSGRAGALAGRRGSRRLERQTQVRVYDERGRAQTLDAASGHGAELAALAARMLDRKRG